MEEIPIVLFNCLRLGGMTAGVALPYIYRKKIQSSIILKIPKIKTQLDSWNFSSESQCRSMLVLTASTGFLIGYLFPPLPLAFAALLYPFKEI